MKCFQTQPEVDSLEEDEGMSCIIQTKYGEFKDSIKLLKRPIPKPSDNEVLVKVHNVTLNPADYKLIHGDFEKIYNMNLPCIIGHDFSGTVSKVGKNVTKYKEGMKVMGFKTPIKSNNGTFAEYISVNSAHIAEIPSNISFDEAGVLGSIGLASYASLFIESDLKSCKSIIIFGGSTSTGLIGIQYAKAIGVKNIIVTTSNGAELCKSYGATHTINYRKENVLDTINKLKLDDITIIYDCVGGLKHWELARKILKSNGTFVSLVGDNTGVKITTGMLASTMFNMMGRKFKSIFNSPNYKPLLGIDPSIGWDFMCKLLKENKLKIPIDNNYEPFKFSLENVIKMCQIQSKGKLKGKLVMRIVSSNDNDQSNNNNNNNNNNNKIEEIDNNDDNNDNKKSENNTTIVYND